MWRSLNTLKVPLTKCFSIWSCHCSMLQIRARYCRTCVPPRPRGLCQWKLTGWMVPRPTSRGKRQSKRGALSCSAGHVQAIDWFLLRLPRKRSPTSLQPDEPEPPRRHRRAWTSAGKTGSTAMQSQTVQHKAAHVRDSRFRAEAEPGSEDSAATDSTAQAGNRTLMQLQWPGTEHAPASSRGRTRLR
jgi:hypothetical protein